MPALSVPSGIPQNNSSGRGTHLAHETPSGHDSARVLAMGSLLEHCLRIAVIDRCKGQQGAMGRTLWDRLKRFSIGDFLREPNEKGSKPFDSTLRAHVDSIIETSDREWWKETSKQLRNKAAHLDIPDLIMNAGRREDLVGDYQDTNDPDRVYGSRFEWGAPFHYSDDLIAAEFLKQATHRLNRLIANMAWKPDTSWWASQQSEYQEFFEYPWDRKVMTESILILKTYWSRE